MLHVYVREKESEMENKREGESYTRHIALKLAEYISNIFGT
jgi:hypothetical protein